MANPWKVLIANKSLSKYTKSKLDFRKFSSGANVIAALASGSLDIAVLGSSPTATAINNGIDIRVIWVMGVIGESEAFVARNGLKVNSVKDLRGKKVAVPFGSTTHYHLLLALQRAGLKETELQILNMQPPSIVSGWKTKSIDAAFVWGSALEEIKKSGKVILTSKQLAKAGHPTFDALVVRTSFLKKNRAFVVSLLKEVNKLYASYNAKPWGAKSPQVKTLSSFVGGQPKDVVANLRGYSFPEKTAQLSKAFLGNGLAVALMQTSKFLKAQKRIDKVFKDYSPFVDDSLAKEVK